MRGFPLSSLGEFPSHFRPRTRSDQTMNAADLIRLHGKSVLVTSTADRSDPPISLRGTLDAREIDGHPNVKIVLDFPDMCNRAAHRGAIQLNDHAITDLLAQSEEVYRYTTSQPLDPGPAPLTDQASE
jgi:hypothetical protein